MGRSVSYPYNALLKEYFYLEYSNEDEEGFNFEFFLEDLISMLKQRFPSLYDDQEWISREDKVHLSNSLVRFGISEYCGIVCLWAIPYKDNHLAENWVNQIRDSFHNYLIKNFSNHCNRIGTFGNGESLYMKSNLTLV